MATADHDAILVFLKKYTPIDDSFIDDFFSLYTIGSNPSSFVVSLDMVAKWLDARKANLFRIVKSSYVLDIDYNVTKNAIKGAKGSVGRGKNTIRIVMLTPDCFKALCMQSQTKKSVFVRSYFIAVEKALFVYRDEIVESLQKRIHVLERNQRPTQELKKIGGIIYVIVASGEMNNVYKLGMSKNFKERLKSHSSAMADNIEIVYIYKTDCIRAVESCAKAMLKKYQYRKYKEVYQTDLHMMKEVISGCGAVCNTVIQLEKNTQIYEKYVASGGGRDNNSAGLFMVFD